MIKPLAIISLAALPLVASSQKNYSEIVVDTLFYSPDSNLLKVSTFYDDDLIYSFETSIVDTIIEIKRHGVLRLKRAEWKTYVLGERSNIQYGETERNVRICQDLTGFTHITFIKKP